MEAKRRAEEEAATLRKKLIAMEERQKRLQGGKANINSAGEPSSPPGFPQVKASYNSDLRLGKYPSIILASASDSVSHDPYL